MTLRGVSEIEDAMEDRLVEAGCDDALLWSRDGVVGLHFGREAVNLGAAVASAINAVMQAGYTVAAIDDREPAAIG